MTTRVLTDAQLERLGDLWVQFKLPTIARELVPRLSRDGHDAALALVLEVMEMEAGDRHQRRMERLLKASSLPPGKTLATLREELFPRPLLAKVRDLTKGEFLECGGNVLCFGLPGVGKSHVAAGIGHALVQRGHSVLYAATYNVVQDLLAAKRDLALPRALRRYDAYELVILDDLGYVQQSSDEAEVLFTLLSERYERRSVMVTSNLVFSEWGRIFKNPMTTAAAVDRLVHHATILEFAPMKTFRTPPPAPAAAVEAAAVPDDNYPAIDDNYPAATDTAEGGPTKPIAPTDQPARSRPTKKLAAPSPA